jgi:hypothetical protein
VTRHPTVEWLAQRIVEAFPWNTPPAYLVRDNDNAYCVGEVSLEIGGRPVSATVVACTDAVGQRAYRCVSLTRRGNG